MEKEKLKAIIFDFDGVIINSENNKFNQLKDLLHTDNIQLTDEHFEMMLGKKNEQFLRETFGNVLNASRISQIAQERRQELTTNPEKYGTPIIDTLVQINELRKKYILAIATGTEEKLVTLLLNKMNILDAFKVIITGNDVTASKPDPAAYTAVLKKLNLQPNEVLAIEDSSAGILAANRAGIQETVGLTTNQTKASLSHATHVVSSLSQVKIW